LEYSDWGCWISILQNINLFGKICRTWVVGTVVRKMRDYLKGTHQLGPPNYLLWIANQKQPFLFMYWPLWRPFVCNHVQIMKPVQSSKCPNIVSHNLFWRLLYTWFKIECTSLFCFFTAARWTKILLLNGVLNKTCWEAL
jgi:hypothetical protein